MEFRQATDDDVDALRRVARASLEASYGHVLDSETLDEAVETWYDTEELAADLADEDAYVPVAVDGGTVVAFAQSYVAEGREPVGELDWLHVHPDERGEGVGSDLLERVETELLARGVARLEGRVLVANEAGSAFYEREGFTEAARREVDVGGESFEEVLYVKFSTDEEGRVVTELRPGPEGEQLYVAYDEGRRASRAPFYVAYADRGREEKYGLFCGNCETFDVAMDAMERVECAGCGNRSKPTRWDAAYL